MWNLGEPGSKYLAAPNHTEEPQAVGEKSPEKQKRVISPRILEEKESRPTTLLQQLPKGSSTLLLAACLSPPNPIEIRRGCTTHRCMIYDVFHLPQTTIKCMHNRYLMFKKNIRVSFIPRRRFRGFEVHKTNQKTPQPDVAGLLSSSNSSFIHRRIRCTQLTI